jgi:hypothetical protein
MLAQTAARVNISSSLKPTRQAKLVHSGPTFEGVVIYTWAFDWCLAQFVGLGAWCAAGHIDDHDQLGQISLSTRPPIAMTDATLCMHTAHSKVQHLTLAGWRFLSMTSSG